MMMRWWVDELICDLVDYSSNLLWIVFILCFWLMLATIHRSRFLCFYFICFVVVAVVISFSSFASFFSFFPYRCIWSNCCISKWNDTDINAGIKQCTPIDLHSWAMIIMNVIVCCNVFSNQIQIIDSILSFYLFYLLVYDFKKS